MAVSLQPHHELVLPWNPKKQQQPHWRRLHTRHRKQQQQQHNDYVAYVKYGVGIAAGISVVGWLKRKIKQLPVVGLLASPFLSLMPTVLLGGAVGAAVVYTLDDGDPMAVQKKVLPKVKQQLQATQRDVATVAADLQRGVHRNIREISQQLESQSNEALRGLTRTLDAATAEAEVTLAPIARKQAEAAQRQLQQLEKQLKEAASEYERSGRQQPQGSSSSSSSCRHTRRHLEAASSSAGDWA